MANIDVPLGQIDGAIAKLTEKGRAGSALEAMASQRKVRDGLVATRLRFHSNCPYADTIRSP